MKIENWVMKGSCDNISDDGKADIFGKRLPIFVRSPSLRTYTYVSIVLLSSNTCCIILGAAESVVAGMPRVVDNR